MSTRDTIQDFEDTIPTRGDHGLCSSSTTDWLEEVDQAKSKPDLEDVGSVFGNTKMSFENLAFPNCERSHENQEP